MPARPRIHAAAIATSLLGLPISSIAEANGRMPAAHQLVVSSTDPTLFVMEDDVRPSDQPRFRVDLRLGLRVAHWLRRRWHPGPVDRRDDDVHPRGHP